MVLQNLAKVNINIKSEKDEVDELKWSLKGNYVLQVYARSLGFLFRGKTKIIEKKKN